MNTVRALYTLVFLLTSLIFVNPVFAVDFTLTSMTDVTNNCTYDSGTNTYTCTAYNIYITGYIDGSGSNGADQSGCYNIYAYAQPGGPGVNIVLSAANLVQISNTIIDLHGGSGGGGCQSTNSGGGGGSLTINTSFVRFSSANVYLYGGGGGSASHDYAWGSNGGNAGDLFISTKYQLSISSLNIDLYGGGGGSGGVSGDKSGVGGRGGNITIVAENDVNIGATINQAGNGYGKFSADLTQHNFYFSGSLTTNNTNLKRAGNISLSGSLSSLTPLNFTTYRFDSSGTINAPSLNVNATIFNNTGTISASLSANTTVFNNTGTISGSTVDITTEDVAFSKINCDTIKARYCYDIFAKSKHADTSGISCTSKDIGYGSYCKIYDAKITSVKVKDTSQNAWRDNGDIFVLPTKDIELLIEMNNTGTVYQTDWFVGVDFFKYFSTTNSKSLDLQVYYRGNTSEEDADSNMVFGECKNSYLAYDGNWDTKAYTRVPGDGACEIYEKYIIVKRNEVKSINITYKFGKGYSNTWGLFIFNHSSDNWVNVAYYPPNKFIETTTATVTIIEGKNLTDFVSTDGQLYYYVNMLERDTTASYYESKIAVESRSNCSLQSDPNNNGVFDVGEVLTVKCVVPASYWDLVNISNKEHLIFRVHERDLTVDEGNNGNAGNDWWTDALARYSSDFVEEELIYSEKFEDTTLPSGWSTYGESRWMRLSCDPDCCMEESTQWGLGTGYIGQGAVGGTGGYYCQNGAYVTLDSPLYQINSKGRVNFYWYTTHSGCQSGGMTFFMYNNTGHLIDSVGAPGSWNLAKSEISKPGKYWFRWTASISGDAWCDSGQTGYLDELTIVTVPSYTYNKHNIRIYTFTEPLGSCRFVELYNACQDTRETTSPTGLEGVGCGSSYFMDYQQHSPTLCGWCNQKNWYGPEGYKACGYEGREAINNCERVVSSKDCAVVYTPQGCSLTQKFCPSGTICAYGNGCCPPPKDMMCAGNCESVTEALCCNEKLIKVGAMGSGTKTTWSNSSAIAKCSSGVVECSSTLDCKNITGSNIIATLCSAKNQNAKPMFCGDSCYDENAYHFCAGGNDVKIYTGAVCDKDNPAVDCEGGGVCAGRCCEPGIKPGPDESCDASGQIIKSAQFTSFNISGDLNYLNAFWELTAAADVKCKLNNVVDCLSYVGGCTIVNPPYTLGSEDFINCTIDGRGGCARRFKSIDFDVWSSSAVVTVGKLSEMPIYIKNKGLLADSYTINSIVLPIDENRVYLGNPFLTLDNVKSGEIKNTFMKITTLATLERDVVVSITVSSTTAPWVEKTIEIRLKTGLASLKEFSWIGALAIVVVTSVVLLKTKKL